MMLNQTFGEYQTLKTIQISELFQVYQAQNFNNQQNYILKITSPQNALLQEHEKEILQKFNSNIIIKFIDQRLDQQNSLTILENCDQTLEEFWKANNKRFSLNYALGLFKMILDGIEILEENLIVHADLCMNNIFLSQHQCKIANFECAHMNKKFLIRSKNSCNAPELFTPVDLTSKADIFSLGCMLFQMIFGYDPFNYENVGNYLVQIQKSQLDMNTQIVQDLNPSVIKLIQDMIQYNPTQRPGVKQIKDFIDKNLEMKSKKNHLFTTQTPQTNPELWGLNQNVIFETQIFTLDYVQSVSKKALFFFEVAEKFGGKEFYNWKKTMYPRFMMYKRSYSELTQFTKEIKAKCNIADFKVQLEKNDKTLVKIKFVLDQFLQLLKKEKEYNYNIKNWEDELNTEITPKFNNNYQKALQFLLEYFKVSQIPYSKQNKAVNFKEMLILQIYIQICQTYNPFYDNGLNNAQDLENLEQQTIEFLYKKAGYES